jgi:hypothetical protein
LGLVEWQHLVGAADSLPHPDGGVVATPNGYLAISYEPDPDSGSLVDYAFWRSPNGCTWERQPLPVPVSPETASVVELRGEVWLRTVYPDSLWRSEDGANWTQIPLPASASLENASLVEAGEEIWLMGASLWKLDGSAWREVDSDPPWLSTSQPVLVANDAGLVAYTHTGSSGGVFSWESPNGSDWSDRYGPRMRPPVERNDFFMDIAEHDDVLLAFTDQGFRTQVYVVDHAGEWAPVMEGDPYYVTPAFFRGGGVLVGSSFDSWGPRIWVSRNLTDWEGGRLGIDTGVVMKTTTGPGREFTGNGAGDKIFFVFSNDETGYREMWVWDFQE